MLLYMRMEDIRMRYLDWFIQYLFEKNKSDTNVNFLHSYFRQLNPSADISVLSEPFIKQKVMYVLEKYKLSDEGDCMGQTDLDDIYMLLEEMK